MKDVLNKIKKLNKNQKILLGIGLATILILITVFSISVKDGKSKIIPNKDELAASNLEAVDKYSKNSDISLATINPTKKDQTGLLIRNRSIVTLRDSKITKYEGEISDKEKSLLTGLNSAVVVSYGSELKMTNVNLETGVEYSNGVYISGEQAKLNIIDSNIETFQYGSSGLVVATKGYLETDHITVSTKVKESPALVVTHKQGTASIKGNTHLETNGSGSPIIRSKGIVDIEGSTATANGSRIAVIEGGNLKVTNSTLISSGQPDDNDTNSPSVILIKNTDEAHVTFDKSSINVNSKLPYYGIATIFDVKEATSTINLKNVQINYGSNNLLKLTQSTTTLNTDTITMQGKISADSASTLNMNMKNGTIYMGALNNSNTNADINLTMDQTSKLILTEDSYITSLTNETTDNKNIILNNHKLFVDGKELIINN